METPFATPSGVSCDNVVREKLPWTVVYYPHLYGTFFAFARNGRSAPALCACFEPAVRNLLALHSRFKAGRPLTENLRAHFPRAVIHRLSDWTGESVFPVPFSPELCHRCNSTPPTLRYCDEAYAPVLIQEYGWYVNQIYLRLGILPHRYVYLADVCPSDLRGLIDAARQAEHDFQQECSRALEWVFSSNQTDSGRANTPLCLLTDEDLVRITELRRTASERRREFKRRIEDIVRQEFFQGVSRR